MEEQLILPDFPATAQGQYDFLEEIKEFQLINITEIMDFVIGEEK